MIADTLLVRANLAFGYLIAGRLDEATRAHEEVYQGMRVHGPDHPLTCAAATNLAACYARSGRLSEAAELHEVTLATRCRVLEEEHPDIMVSRYAPGLTYKDMERYDEAIALLNASVAERSECRVTPVRSGKSRTLSGTGG